jgi:elongation factor P--(R)-beta-lysine ligase
MNDHELSEVARMSKKHLHMRARLLHSTRAFFESRGYLEVETPSLVPSPGLDTHLDAFETDGPPESRYLTTSPEYQMKRLLVGGAARIFQIGKAFRKGERGDRHNPEFTMVEFYRKAAAVSDIMRDTEQLIARLTGGSVLVDGASYCVQPPFLRLTVRQAFQTHAGIDEAELLQLADTNHDKFFELLAFVVEPALAKLPEAVFLTEYPAQFASLARKKESDPRYAERFELYVAGLELCNGFGELTCASEQEQRFMLDQAERKKLGKPVYPIDQRFLEALRQGMPECSGNAIGFDRVCALACGTREIGRTLAFAASEL